MGLSHSPSIVTSNLILALDAANPKSYSGSGNTWFDITGRGNHGTLINGPSYSSSSGGYISCDGTNDYIEVLDNSIFDFDLMISLWNIGLEKMPLQLDINIFGESINGIVAVVVREQMNGVWA